MVYAEHATKDSPTTLNSSARRNDTVLFQRALVLGVTGAARETMTVLQAASITPEPDE